MAHTHQSEKSRYKQLGTEGDYKNSKFNWLMTRRREKKQLQKCWRKGKENLGWTATILWTGSKPKLDFDESSTNMAKSGRKIPLLRSDQIPLGRSSAKLQMRAEMATELLASTCQNKDTLSNTLIIQDKFTCRE